MSGSKEKKRSKTQGWEEAGGEFYQESYPVDMENMHRDPSKLATLLPSKQNRNATNRRVRNQQQETKTTRRRNSTLTATRTFRRGSQYQEIQVSTMPDLSENLINEERTWEEIHEIKQLPVPMAQKRELKAQLQNATKLRLQGFEQIKWKRRKAWQKIATKWTEYITKMELWRNSLKKIEGNFGTGVVAYFQFLRWLMFLNLLIFSIIFAFIILPQLILVEPRDIPCDLTAPPITTMMNVSNDITNQTSGYSEQEVINYPNATTQCCTDFYLNETKTLAKDISILHIVQGTGFMEKTLLFYGMYTNMIYGYNPRQNYAPGPKLSAEEPQIGDGGYLGDSNFTNVSLWNTLMQSQLPDSQVASAPLNTTSKTSRISTSFFSKLDVYYDLPLAYIIVIILCYLYTLIAIVKAVAHEFKDRLVEGEGQFYQYCNLVFGGWDFCIHNEKSAQIKYKALYNEIQSLMHLRRFEYERNNRSKDMMLKLFVVRFLINLLVCVILVLCGTIIYVLFNFSLSKLEPNFNTITRYRSFNVFMKKIKKMSTGEESLINGLTYDNEVNKQMEILFYEFVPYVSIVCFNLLVPLLFNYLVQFEQYSPLFVIKMNLFRTIGLRLSSLAVLISRFYYLVSQKHEDGNIECYNKTYGTPQCWETFIGQQFYKLFIVDFVTHIFVTFFINFPRGLIARHTTSKVAKFIGEQEFELSKHVLDVVYSQTICWLGSFYAPFLPAIAAMLNFLMFYIKKFACLVNSKPSSILYRASRSNSLFMIILLLSFTIAIIPVVYAIAELIPSKSCGPFRGLNSTWDRAIEAFMKLPDFMRNIIFFFGTSSFAIPCFIVLILFLYYYYSLSSANKHMVQVLKNQLVLEGHDKQFLLHRLSQFIKQQQESAAANQKRYIETQNLTSTTTNSQQSQQPPPLHQKSRSSGGNSGDRSERSARDRRSDIGDI